MSREFQEKLFREFFLGTFTTLGMFLAIFFFFMVLGISLVILHIPVVGPILLIASVVFVCTYTKKQHISEKK